MREIWRKEHDRVMIHVEIRNLSRKEWIRGGGCSNELKSRTECRVFFSF